MPRPCHRHLWRSCPRVGLSCGRAEGSHCRSPARVRSRDSRRPTGQRERMGRAGPQCGQPEQRGELHPPQETCTVGLKEESCLSPAGWGRWQHWFTPCWPPHSWAPAVANGVTANTCPLCTQSWESISQQPHEVRVVTIPTLQLQKMRLGEVKLYAQGHTAGSGVRGHGSFCLGVEELHQRPPPPGQPVGCLLWASPDTGPRLLTRWPQIGR